MTGMLYDSHYVYSNRESGDGRYDILMEPKSSQFPGIIFEFKVLQDSEARKTNVKDALQKLAGKALQQIEEKSYSVDLEKRGVSHIIKYGIGFYKKDLFIMKA